MMMGTQQLFRHVTVWSQIPTALTAVDPLALTSLTRDPAEAINSLNRFVREMRLQEIELLKSLEIDPDRLADHIRRKRSFPDFFIRLNPRPDWMGIHPQLTLTIDDLHQLRQAIAGAKRRLNAWEKLLQNNSLKLKAGKPAKLDGFVTWLQESAHVRSELAREAVSTGESDASVGIAQFYDPWIRQARRVLTMEESVKTYLGIIPTRSGP